MHVCELCFQPTDFESRPLVLEELELAKFEVTLGDKKESVNVRFRGTVTLYPENTTKDDRAACSVLISLRKG